MAFSQGFHPLPLISFGRALPVGVQSACEWFSVTLRENLSAMRLINELAPCLPRGILAYRAVPVPYKDKTMQAVSERFHVTLDGGQDELERCFRVFQDASAFPFTRETKKGERTCDVRPLVQNIVFPGNPGETGVTFDGDWGTGYLSPLLICRAILAPLGDFTALAQTLHITKTAQFMPDGTVERGVH